MHFTQVKPKPNFLLSTAIQAFTFDQKYAKKGASRAQHRGQERVDASGDLIDLVSTVLVNMVRQHLPYTLGGGLTPDEVGFVSPATLCIYLVVTHANPC